MPNLMASLFPVELASPASEPTPSPWPLPAASAHSLDPVYCYKESRGRELAVGPGPSRISEIGSRGPDLGPDAFWASPDLERGDSERVPRSQAPSTPTWWNSKLPVAGSSAPAAAPVPGGAGPRAHLAGPKPAPAPVYGSAAAAGAGFWQNQPQHARSLAVPVADSVVLSEFVRPARGARVAGPAAAVGVAKGAAPFSPTVGRPVSAGRQAPAAGV